MKKLLPCPFCGSDDVYLMERGQRTEVQCGKCFARGGPHALRGGAINKWNKRHLTLPAPDSGSPASLHK